MSTINNSDELRDYASIVYTYKVLGSVHELGKYYLTEKDQKDLKSILGKMEFVVLQTCNRVEIYIHDDTNSQQTVNVVLEFLHTKKGANINKAIIYFGRDVVYHLFRVASGLDSLSIGEYEILRQIRQAMEESLKLGFSNKYLKLLFEEAIKVGRYVRESTGISRGKVGIYSLALEFAKEKLNLNDFGNINIAIIGAGEIGRRIVYLLKSNGAKNVTIFNRSLDKAKMLAEKLGYNYGQLDFNSISNYDIVFSAINYEEKIKNNKAKIIIDLAVPPIFYGDNVYTLNDLIPLSIENYEKRIVEISRAEKIIKNMILKFEEKYENSLANEIISRFMTRIENIRIEEVMKAKKKIMKAKSQDEILEIIDKMSKSFIKKAFQPIFFNVRTVIKNNEENYINYLTKILSDGNFSNNKAEKIKKEQVNS